MKAFFASWLILGLLGGALFAQQPKTVDPEIIRGLRSMDRTERLGALKKVAALQEIPDSLVEPIAGFIKLDLTDALAPDGPKEKELDLEAANRNPSLQSRLPE
jgi:hypothetical protein